MTENERVKAIKEALNLTLEEFGEKLGVTRQAISNIVNGNRNVTEQMRTGICREFNVDYLWLTTGEGEMFTDLPENLFDELALQYDLTEEEKNVVRDFLSLSKEERAIVMKYMRPNK